MTFPCRNTFIRLKDIDEAIGCNTMLTWFASWKKLYRVQARVLLLFPHNFHATSSSSRGSFVWRFAQRLWIASFEKINPKIVKFISNSSRGRADNSESHVALVFSFFNSFIFLVCIIEWMKWLCVYLFDVVVGRVDCDGEWQILRSAKCLIDGQFLK